MEVLQMDLKTTFKVSDISDPRLYQFLMQVKENGEDISKLIKNALRKQYLQDKDGKK